MVAQFSFKRRKVKEALPSTMEEDSGTILCKFADIPMSRFSNLRFVA